MPSVTRIIQDGLAVLRLDREHGNAINEDLVCDLAAAVRETAADPSVRGALLTSAGKMFCPGLDLIELVDRDRPYLAGFLRGFQACLRSLYTYPKPLVAALGGHALAGGCVLGLTADWRVLRAGALIGLNEIRVGLPLPFGIAEILRAALPASRLQEVALLGRNYADDEAVATGLVHEIHPAEGFEAHALSRLDEFASRDPGAFARTKEYLRAATVERIDAQDDARVDEFLDGWFSDSARRRVAEIVDDLRARGK